MKVIWISPIEFDKVPPAPISKLGLRSKELLEELEARSIKRRESSEDFAELFRDIKRYREQKEKKYVELNEEKFFAARAEFDAKKEEEKEFKEQLGDDEDEDESVVKRDYYIDEVLAITSDYVKLLNR